MKKKNLKSLKLNKKSISNLKPSQLNGGQFFITAFGGDGAPCETFITTCGASVWVCNTVRDCPTNFCEPITQLFLCE